MAISKQPLRTFHSILVHPFGKGFFLLIGVIGILFVPIPHWQNAPQSRHFRVEASTFQYSPGVLKVQPGDRVTIELVATDVVHGLTIDGYNIDLTAEPGQTASVTFIANRAGTFRIRCSVACGALHPFMLGKFQVGLGGLFWRAALMATLAAGTILVGKRV